MSICVIYYIFLSLTILIGIGLLSITMTFSQFYYISYKFNNEAIILYIQQTLNYKFIYEFNPREKCEDGEEKLASGSWDGTIDKCKCSETIKNFSCTGEEDSSCHTIEGVKPKNYTIFEGKEICVIRKGDTYYNLVKSNKIISKDKNCSQTEKSCGVVDTFGRKLCVKIEEDCPINKNNIEKKFLYKFISKINNEKIMNFLDEKNDEEKIISIIKLSYGLPCLNISSKNWTSYHPEEKYKSQECQPINGKTTDDRYEKFETFKTTKYNLYMDNNLSYYITDSLISDNKTINLYGTNLIGLNILEDGYDYDKLLSIQDSLNTYTKIMDILSYIILGIIFGSIIFLRVMAFCEDRCSNCEDWEDSGLFLIFAIIIGLIFGCAFLAQIILIIIFFVSIIKIEWLLENGLNIGDDAIKEMIKEFVEKHSFNYSFPLAAIILSALFIVSGIVTLITRCKKKDDY